MRGIWILLSAAALLQTCASVPVDPVGPPTIEYMDGADAAKVVFDENTSENVKSDSSNSTSPDAPTPTTDSPSSIAESEAESNDENEAAPTTLSPIDLDNILDEGSDVGSDTPDADTKSDEAESDSSTPSSSIDMS